MVSPPEREGGLFESPFSIAPPSGVPLGETHDFVQGEDGTRLFVRSRDQTDPPADPSRIAGAPRAFLCDGIACAGFVWKYLWDDLAPAMPLTHWNYRGHGRSAAPVDPTHIDIPSLAADLTCVREHLGDPPCALIGHSLGVQVCLENYRQRPENVRALVLICGTFGRVTETFHGVPVLKHVLPFLIDAVVKRPSLSRAIWSRMPQEVALKMALWLGEVDAARLRPEDMMPYLSHVTTVDLPMFLGMLRAAGDHTAEDVLPLVQVPVLVVAGARDTFTPAYLAEQMAERIPHAELLVVEGGSHVASLEQHAMVDERIADFLRKYAGT